MMSENDLSQRIRVISIQRDLDSRPQRYNIIMAYMPDHYLSPTMKFEVKIDAQDFNEDALVKIARSWFHGFCKDLATHTEKWALSKEDFESFRTKKDQ